MTPTDCRPDYPVQALLIGGPMHDKRLNLEAGTTEYVCTESNLNAAHIPTNHGYNESKYVYYRDLGDLSLFVHEICKIPDAHRVPALHRAAQKKIQDLYDEKADLKVTLEERQAEIAALKEEQAEFAGLSLEAINCAKQARRHLEAVAINATAAMDLLPEYTPVVLRPEES